MSDNSNTQSSTPNEMLPENTRISKAYIVKIGLIHLLLKENLREKVWGDKSTDIFDQFVSEIYSTLSDSPHVMEISPKKETLIGKDTNPENVEDFLRTGVHIWQNASSVSLTRFMKIRVAFPARIREELGFLPWSWCPEQFYIYFNGAIFVAIAEADNVPVYSDLGQVAREFLKKTLSTNSMWEVTGGASPSPIHTDIYIAFMTSISEEKPDKSMIPSKILIGGDLRIKFADTTTIDDFMDDFLFSILFPIESFYMACLLKAELRDAINDLVHENQGLSKMVSAYFEQHPIRRLLSPLPRQIRKLLGKMHLSLHSISAKELALSNAKGDAIRTIQESKFFDELESYFVDKMEPSRDYDRNSQLTAMNFAAEETSHVTIAHTTLSAALIGAVVGGFITLLAQMVLN